MVWAAIAIAAIGLIGAILGLVSLTTPMPRLFFTSRRRAGLLLIAGVAVAAAAAFAPIRHGCGCAPRPIPNVLAMTLGVKMLEEGSFGTAQAAFDHLINDGRSFELRPAALYGRGLCKQALGDVDGAKSDFAAAAASDPPGAEEFKRFQASTGVHAK